MIILNPLSYTADKVIFSILALHQEKWPINDCCDWTRVWRTTPNPWAIFVLFLLLNNAAMLFCGHLPMIPSPCKTTRMCWKVFRFGIVFLVLFICMQEQPWRMCDPAGECFYLVQNGRLTYEAFLRSQIWPYKIIADLFSVRKFLFLDLYKRDPIEKRLRGTIRRFFKPKTYLAE